MNLGNITDAMIKKYIDEQGGEPVIDDTRFQIDPSDESELVLHTQLFKNKDLPPDLF